MKKLKTIDHGRFEFQHCKSPTIKPGFIEISYFKSRKDKKPLSTILVSKAQVIDFINYKTI